MTVSEIRSLMLEKVIPESLLPQNIAVCLMDENAAPPELDAFTFLNRLRSLGIGSADFLYLLKGCGAPEEAVSKIEQHPDMNLQTLIITLESSGLTPKDYTRMLYTARQLWEHTITMRIDSGELEAAAESRQEEQPEPQDPAGSEESTVQEAPAAEESTPEESAETTEPTEPSEPPRPVRTARQKKRRTEESYEDESPEQEAPVLTARQKKRTIDDLAEELGIAAEIEDEPEEKYTARQRKRRKEETAPETEPEQSAEVREDSPKARRNAIIAAAAGAAVLFAIDPLMDILGFTAPGSSGGEFQFASDNAAVFSEIYTAYTNGRISSEKTQKLSENEQVFGDMLINSGKELGVFGTIHPTVAARYGLSGEVLAAELQMDALLAAIDPEKLYHPLPKFPASTRDIAVLVDDAVPAASMQATVEKAAGKLLESVKLFDVYKGKGIPEGKKSVAYSLSLRAPDRTLTDEECDKAMRAAISALETEFGAQLRG